MTVHKIPQILSGVIMMIMMASRSARVSAFVLPKMRQAATKAIVASQPQMQPTRLFSATEETVAPPAVLKRVKTINAVEPTEESIVVKGWVRTIRKQKTLAFVQVNDGSNLKGIQCVVSFDEIDENTQKGAFASLVVFVCQQKAT